MRIQWKSEILFVSTISGAAVAFVIMAFAAPKLSPEANSLILRPKLVKVIPIAPDKPWPYGGLQFPKREKFTLRANEGWFAQ